MFTDYKLKFSYSLIMLLRIYIWMCTLTEFLWIIFSCMRSDSVSIFIPALYQLPDMVSSMYFHGLFNVLNQNTYFWVCVFSTFLRKKSLFSLLNNLDSEKQRLLWSQKVEHAAFSHQGRYVCTHIITFL